MDGVFQVQVVRRGVITLPKEMRDRNRIAEGDILTLVELGDGVFVLSPGRSRVDAAADRLAQSWQNADQSLESMLAALREVREGYGPENS